MAKLRRFSHIRVTDDTIAAFAGFELLSYGDMRIVVRNRMVKSDVIIYELWHLETYEELLEFFNEILPLARPDPMW